MQKLINLIRQFDLGDIALPIMQRDHVWRPCKVEALLESLYNAWPKSWPSGQLLAEACKVVNGTVGIEVHHLFPRKFVE
jgi:hypothetical protein